MAQNKIVTDENLMESAKHGTDSYPFKCYFEKLSQFDFHCIDGHWHQNGNLYMLNPET